MNELKAAVYSNLDNTHENGAFDPGESLSTSTPEEIASDMITYAEDVEDIEDPALLVPHIISWLEAKQITLQQQ